jgi:major cell surface glycoprotein (TIGR04216 family)
MSGIRGTVLILVIVAAVTGALAVSATSETTTSVDQAPPINTTEAATDTTTTSEPTATPRQYTVTATSAAAVNQTALARYGAVGTQADTQVELRMPPSNVSKVDQLPWVTDVQPAVRPAPADIPGSADGTSLGVEHLHEQGVTGEGVKIGVIDNGFDRSEINGNIQASVSFRQMSGSTDHGTSVATIVTQTAPDSQLYLASAETGVDHQRAIEYLANQDVDIIVYSIYWPAVEDDGDNFLTNEITAARQQGTLFVTSAGNEAERHWEGNFRDTDSDGMLEWNRLGHELNALPGRLTEFPGGDVRMYIRWEERGAPSRYRAALYNPNTEQYVAVGEDRGFSTATNRYSELDATVRSQQLVLVIENTAGPADDEIEIAFLSGPSEIEHNVPFSSITAPADVPAAVAVGAYERGTYVQQSGMASYSGRGPTDDGRRGVDVTGYTNIDTGGSQPFGGTSAAAPYVGGVAALIEDRQHNDPPPANIETALKSTSDDIRRPGPDTVSGTGVVDATSAVGVTIIEDGDTVFQGQESLTFVDNNGDIVTSLTGVSGDAEGQVLATPIPQDQTTGTYSSDGTSSSSVVVTVNQPRISDFEIQNQNGEDITGNSVDKPNTANLNIFVEYSYAEYENVEITVEDPNGLEIQGDVVQSPSAGGVAGRTGSPGTTTVEFDLDLTGQESGIYTVTAEGAGDLDFGSATTSGTIELTAEDSVDVEFGSDTVTQGNNVRYEIVGSEAGDYHFVKIDGSEFHDNSTPKDQAEIFRNVENVVERGIVADIGATDDTRLHETNELPDAGQINNNDISVNGTYAIVEIDDDTGLGVGSIDTSALDDSSVTVEVSDNLTTASDGEPATRSGGTRPLGDNSGSSGTLGGEAHVTSAGELNADDNDITVKEGTVSLDSPDRSYVIDSEVDVTGTAAPAIDDVAIYVRDEGEYKLVQIDGETTISVDADGVFTQRDILLSAGSAPGNNILSITGSYQFGVIDAADTDLNRDGRPDDSLTSLTFDSGTSAQRPIRALTQTSNGPTVSATVEQAGSLGGQAFVQYTVTNVSGQSSVALEFTTPSQVSVNPKASDTEGTFGSDNQQLVFIQPGNNLTTTIAFDLAGSAGADATFDIEAAALDEDTTTTDSVTTTVGDVETGPVQRFDTDDDGDISLSEVQAAIRAFSNGELDLQGVQQVIGAFSS